MYSVLQICPWGTLGGAERQLQSLVRCLSGSFRISVMVPDGPIQPEMMKDNPDIDVFELSYPMSLFDLFRFPTKITEIVNNQAIDIIHIHAARELSFIIGLSQKKIPTVFTPHAYSSGGDIWTAVKLGALRADKVICFSKWEYEMLTKAGLSPDKLAIIPNGIQIKHIDMHKKQRELVIGCAARLLRDKCLDLLIRAYANIRTKWAESGTEVQLVIVGDGELRSSLELLVNSLGVSNSVRFTGAVTDPMSYMADFDIFALPSRRETFGLAICEAMSIGIPVIAAKVGGVTELIEHGKTGLLIEPDNQEALESALLTLIREPDMRTRLGEEAKEVVRKKFSDNVMADKTGSLYTSLIEGRVP